MPDLHVPTIRFLNTLLKIKQTQMANAATDEQFLMRHEEFENLRRRLCRELIYALGADAEHDCE